MAATTQVTIDGKTFRTDDLTLDEACDIEKECGVSWLNMNPFRSAIHCRAILIAFLTRERGSEEARKFVGCLTVDETLGCLKVVDDDLPEEFEGGVPLEAAGTATTGS